MNSRERLGESSNQLIIKNELTTLSNKTADVARNVLLIAGVATGFYFLYKLLFSKNEEDKKSLSNNTFDGFTRILKVLTNQALLYILKESKNKIQQYLNEIEKDAVNT